MDGKYANKSAAPRSPTCGTPMQLVRKTSRFAALHDLYSFYCLACDAWHVEEGGAVADRSDRRATRRWASGLSDRTAMKHGA